MRNYLRSLVSGLAGGLMIAGALAPAFALTVPPTFTPRQLPWQATHYLRFQANFNSCTPVALTCSFKVGALPYNAYVIRANQQVYTAFTGGGATTATLSVGTSATPTTELVAAQSVFAATAGLPLTVVAANLGTAATGNTIAQSGADGGFDVWARLTWGTAQSTQGSAVVIIEFIAPNDGSCAPVPMGSTAVGC